ncbi:hypothetical protein GCM10008098_05050 [Rhodanobacter panaciterrae]|uniref:DUF3887 domain-containing protein n=1 Tax=Rhodanobacter panaciterrae TaxID=490572 RepID=A0ABQ2ZHJ1_9GAMM|nr:hypothetical protein [Rhodanobacter panaciterrae]GGY16693.1 hypothetical protein GCM10008098_05050 [Rhodanobacter panaciterrae]
MKLAFAVCITLGLAVGTAHAADADCQATSSRMLDHLDKRDYLGATADFNERMKASLSVDRLARLWQAKVQHPDLPDVRGPVQLSNVQGYAVVVTPLHHGQDQLNTRVVCDADGKIGGFFVKSMP